MDKLIEIKNLNKSFGDNQVLKDISLDLFENENLVILGRSGQGKSVLLKCIVRLMESDSGVIKLFDTDIHGLSDKELNRLRTRIGFLFQGGALFDSMTIQQNLDFVLKRLKKELSEKERNYLIDRSLDSVELKNVKNSMPSELSGGMKKRAGLARTLVLQPEVILYDEPTTGLDPFSVSAISELIVRLKELYKTSSVIVTHDMKCVNIAGDRIAVLNNAVKLADGRYKELQKSNDPVVSGFFD